MWIAGGAVMTSTVEEAGFFILPALSFDVEEVVDDDVVVRLRELLQVALQVEFSTIPPYLTALYSIKDKSSPAYQLVRGVVMEEMVHLNLAGNLLNAVGGTPRLVVTRGEEVVFPPRYPQHLSEKAADGGPYLQLMPASRELFRETFMRIEQPAQPDAPAQEDEFTTIGQLYLAVEKLFRRYDEVCGEYRTEYQSDDWNFGNNGGTVIVVDSLRTALEAINEVVEQGEGADLTNRPADQKYEIKQPWGQYEYYGPRADGTYGPVLGTPLEMSHYFKFKAIADGTTPLPPVYPMTPNPGRVGQYENPVAQRLSDMFDLCYSELVDQLEIALGGRRDEGSWDREAFFTRVVPLMRVALPVLATQLMQTPVVAPAYTTVDPVAGPAFRYVPAPRERLEDLRQGVVGLQGLVADDPLADGSDTLVAALRKVGAALEVG